MTVADRAEALLIKRLDVVAMAIFALIMYACIHMPAGIPIPW